MFNIETLSDRAFELGEGPHWNPVDEKLYFVDILTGQIATYDSNGKFNEIYKNNNDETVSVVLPVNDNNVVISVGNSLRLLDLQTKTEKLIDKISVDGHRFNDGKCDPSGRIWIGTMGKDFSNANSALYRLNPATNKLEVQIDEIILSNGLCWSLDSKKMYYIDSGKRSVFLFDYDIDNGNISNKRTFLNMNDNKDFDSDELPDGMTIDVNGNLWIAMFRGSRIVNIDGRNGKLLQSIKMPTSLITSVCFGGGPNLDIMYVTSSRHYLTDDQKIEQPLAGYCFRITSKDLNFKGFKPNFNANIK
ncbi:hypothetical protein DERP_006406 [Dermatophagoides pteronyssinus]|uniref:SMP-30/Gluconolactonase/LRE-like region domain-containing protein n=1 Tax=Dermatophagoides pteronyssinus TaxID=6956 RepID=A0ABQ8IYC2_DERPT|nr:hypothetical protein DERP_006406 [Dermatophagoides pteronyssinus]